MIKLAIRGALDYFHNKLGCRAGSETEPILFLDPDPAQAKQIISDPGGSRSTTLPQDLF